jgi:hypothetical protein
MITVIFVVFPVFADDNDYDSGFTNNLVIGGAFGFASGPISSIGGDSFEGVGGLFYVGREVADFLTLGGKFEWYTYRDAPYDFYSDEGVDQALYEIGLMARLYPFSFAGLRPYVGTEVGIYTRIYSEGERYSQQLENRVEPGFTGRAGLEIFLIGNLAVDFGASYSLDNNAENRLEVLSGYAGGVYYFK